MLTSSGKRIGLVKCSESMQRLHFLLSMKSRGSKCDASSLIVHSVKNRRRHPPQLRQIAFHLGGASYYFSVPSSGTRKPPLIRTSILLRAICTEYLADCSRVRTAALAGAICKSFLEIWKGEVFGADERPQLCCFFRFILLFVIAVMKYLLIS